MDDLYFSVSLADNHTLCLAPLTDRRLAMSGQEIDDTSGYFLYSQRGTGETALVEVIAKVLTPDAAMVLRDMFKMS